MVNSWGTFVSGEHVHNDVETKRRPRQDRVKDRECCGLGLQLRQRADNGRAKMICTRLDAKFAAKGLQDFEHIDVAGDKTMFGLRATPDRRVLIR